MHFFVLILYIFSFCSDRENINERLVYYNDIENNDNEVDNYDNDNNQIVSVF